MAKVTRHSSGGERILFLIAGLVCGYLTLQALPYALHSTENQIFTAFLGLMSAGGFIGAFKGEQSI